MIAWITSDNSEMGVFSDRLKQNSVEIRLLERCEFNLRSSVSFSDQFQPSGFMKW